MSETRTLITAGRTDDSARRWSVISAVRRRRLSPGGVLVWLALIAFAVFFALPMVWLLLAPTKTAYDLEHTFPFSFGSFAAVGQAWQHLAAFQGGIIYQWFGNSALYAFGGLALSLICSVPAGYGLALTRFRGRKLLLMVTLIVMIMPATTLVIPLFLELNAMRLIGTPLALILPFAFFPFGVYLTYIYFSTSLQRSMLEAARIDGATEVQIFFRIALPLARPIIALVAFFSFVANWQNFFLPYLVMPVSTQQPIQVGLSQLMASSATFNPGGTANLGIESPELALAILLSVIPVLVLFLFAQRSLVAGMFAGGTKG
ncbi:carbohydrate ABC transporter permease [Microbacterium rhizosphaerae]|uniref:Carbohydrate ABC transporter permease n=1 Tax=Microbacterium rhizosphaerae TaxID=1678237 RepID=A0ABZ0SJA0_9MICO|nr:carbohydrate ABC transporter permease [Microbacterium rhizosphaerae]WPR89442.1 carbohydrate ABC transporter permease [Microbacterium rhizosphaerae]